MAISSPSQVWESWPTEEIELLTTCLSSGRAIRPRMAYADWLEERGHPKVADFVRWQCRQHKIGMGPEPDITWGLYVAAERYWKPRLSIGEEIVCTFYGNASDESAQYCVTRRFELGLPTKVIVPVATAERARELRAVPSLLTLATSLEVEATQGRGGRANTADRGRRATQANTLRESLLNVTRRSPLDNIPRDVDEDDEDDQRCPICDSHVEEGYCDHVLAALSIDVIEFPHTKAASNDALNAVLNQLRKEMERALTEEQLSLLTAVASLPDGLRQTVVDSFDSMCPGLAYFESLVKELPTVVGCADGFADGGGTSSSWTTYWSESPTADSKLIDERFKAGLRELRTLIKVAREARSA